jgi:hypothetical protein
LAAIRICSLAAKGDQIGRASLPPSPSAITELDHFGDLRL